MIYHVHSPALRNTCRPWLNWINNITERFSLRRASRLITVSQSLKEHMIRQGFDASRITVVHNGVPALYEIPFRRLPRGQWTIGNSVRSSAREKGSKFCSGDVAFTQTRVVRATAGRG